MDKMKELAEKVEKGKNQEVPALVQEILDGGATPYDVLLNGLQAGLLIIGERFKKDECFIPEVLLSVRAMKAGMKILEPLLAEAGSEPIAKVVLGTVKDDLHDIGKNMVGMMLEGSGFKVIDIGINVSESAFLDAVMREGPDILAMSALLSTTMPYLKTTIDTLKEHGVRDKIKVLVGGAPVTEEYALESGADGYAPDSAHAVDKAKELIMQKISK
ncbi:methionine synthase [bacterium BMS3Bbin06]|nr:methionine synthase [bacterium BMS3Abin08]GBE34784.1 methionine synthase [bacterium BMS3Bbin06]HDY72160.1 cobalamin-binding protein [Nitrospirota bacterium]